MSKYSLSAAPAVCVLGDRVRPSLERCVFGFCRMLANAVLRTSLPLAMSFRAPAMASFMKARALHQLGKPDEALKAYGNAIAVDKEFGQAYYNRGLLKVAMKNVGSSCEDFQLARALEYPGADEAFIKYCK